MQVEVFYGKILGIESPWDFADVRLDQEVSVVHVTLAHEERTRWKCPCCDRALAIYDHVEERQWRHRWRASRLANMIYRQYSDALTK
jgi:hypothetical protein